MRIFKRLCPAAAFLILFVLINFLLNDALIPYQYPRVKIHTIETQTFDDLIVGTSHSFSAINPEILSSSTGRSCYNASVGSQFPRDTLYLLMDACRSHRPGRIILEYDPAYLVDADRAFALGPCCDLSAFADRRDPLITAEVAQLRRVLLRHQLLSVFQFSDLGPDPEGVV